MLTRRTIGRRTCAPPISRAWYGPRRIRRTASRWRRPHPATRAAGRRRASGSPAATLPAGYETTPDGNAVILEEQMAKATETALDFQLTSNLYRKYVGMMRIALGTQP